MKTLKALTTLFLFGGFFNVQASVGVLFHPYDPTLQVIARVFSEAQRSAQVSMYNIDVTDQSPLIQYLKSADFQKKLQRGFVFQMIFEGYATPAENQKKMKDLEALGIDVRFMGIAQKVHHKFALIDAGLPHERLITGSANWSLASMNNYDENILFIENEKGIQSQFSQEFALLWTHAQEFGHTLFSEVSVLPVVKLKGDLHSFFNSSNYDWDQPRGPKIAGPVANPHLTKTIVAAIDHAKSEIQIATTRIKLAPVYAALMRAANRGVQIKIVVSQAEYLGAESRKNLRPQDCGQNLFDPACSAGVNFSPMLAPEQSGFENMEIRVKFFSLNLADNIAMQMHNKYMIIDNHWVLSGSFNWSNSSEWQHIENVVVIDGARFPLALVSFRKNFGYVWNMNRNQGTNQFMRVGTTGSKACGINPTVLTFQEIDLVRSKASALGICH
jgi:phosphatidylserine/phosphatidylglycerophosphate/cardiolipin synthase-like enzyme